jgi:hypothetical protein
MCGRQWGIDFVLNIALFVPLGLVLRVVRVPLFPALLVMLALTFVIEVLQLVIPGRITSIDDLVANTVGGLLGFALGGRIHSIAAPAPRQAAAAVLAAGAATLVVLWGTLWLFEPAPTRHAYWGQFSPRLGQFGYFDGTVIEARVDDQSLRNGRLPNTDAVRERLRRDSVTVRAVVHGGGEAHRLAPVVSIFDGRHNEVMLMGRSRGGSFTFRLRSRATVVGLQTPEVTVWRAFPKSSGSATDPVRLSGTVHGYSLTATAKTDTSCVTRTIHFRPTQGWAYLVPFENLITAHAAKFTTIWLAIIFGPLGYYAVAAIVRHRGAVRRVAVVLWVATVAAIALAALPLAAGLSGGTAAEWRGALIGIASGALIGAAAMAMLRSRERLPVTYN